MKMVWKYSFQKKMEKGCKKRCFLQHRRVDKPVDTLADGEKQGVFCEIVFVAVQRCCREGLRKKQETAGFLDENLAVLFLFL